MLLQFLPKNIYPYRSTVKVSPSRQSLQRLFEHQSSCWQFWELRYVLWLITDRSSGVQKVAVITDATTSSLSIYTQPQLLHPASAYTPRLFTASTPSLSFYIQPQPIHPDPSQPIYPASASTSGLSLYTQPQLLHPASTSTPSLSLYIRTQPLHPASASISSLNLYIQLRLLHIDPSQPLYTVRKINWLRYCLAIFDQFPQFH